MSKMAHKQSKTAQNPEIYLKVYTVNYHYWTKTLQMFRYYHCSLVYKKVFSAFENEKNGPKNCSKQPKIIEITQKTTL